MKTFKEVRAAFWAAHPQFKSEYRKTYSQNDYRTDIRVCFVDYVDQLRKIEIITVRSLPYKEYIHSFDRAHIVLDQVFSYDQGFNALEAMAKGKVVFTGADQEWLDYYKLKKDTVAINALPDAEKIAQKLEWLIENPDQLKIISKNARAFIEREHNGLNVATSYLKTWEMHSEF